MKSVVWFDAKKKLSPRYLKPYKILKWVSKVDYEFDL